MASILGLPRPVMPSGRQVGGRQNFPCPCQGVSLIPALGHVSQWREGRFSGDQWMYTKCVAADAAVDFERFS